MRATPWLFLFLLPGCSGDNALPEPEAARSVPVSAIRITSSPASTVLVNGSQLWVAASAYDAKGTLLPEQPEVTWESRDPAVVTVRTPDGPSQGNPATITAVGSGHTVVTATVDGVVGELAVAVLPPLPPGESSLSIVDFRWIEYAYPGTDAWYYTPLVRVEEHGGTGVDILGLEVISRLSFCASIRLRAGESTDLVKELYGDWEFSLGPSGARADPSEEVTVVVEYRTGNGTRRSVSAKSRVIAGGLPTTYSGGVGRWSVCAMWTAGQSGAPR